MTYPTGLTSTGKKWTYPNCPNHPKTKLEIMQLTYDGSQLEFCKRGCIWGYLSKDGKWHLMRVIVI